MPVSTLFATTVAPETAAPEESVMTPDNVAATWACKSEEQQQKIRDARVKVPENRACCTTFDGDAVGVVL